MRIIRTPNKMAVVMLISSLVSSQARAWDPPSGTAPDQANSPATPTTLLPKAHGYITQNGISILNNDGYWFAAQTLREWQQELLNGARYADKKDGDQRVYAEICTLLVLCETNTIKSWPLAADEHYYNPDTRRGYRPSDNMKVAATWAPYIATAFGLLLINPLVLRANVGVDPELKSQYKSAIVKFDEEYRHALSAASGLSTPDLSINGREGMALAMFYLGWASHLVQDQTVVHHTFDSVDHHGEYEAAADLDSPDRDPVLANLIETPLRANGQQMGLYDNQVSERLSALNKPSCEATGRNCFAFYAAYVSHDEAVLDATKEGDYTNVRNAIPLAQNLQAGLYASFLTDIGLPPVHMSAVMAVL